MEKLSKQRPKTHGQRSQHEFEEEIDNNQDIECLYKWLKQGDFKQEITTELI
ncbi:unnamed protein product [Paramecium octaurelia]|uniref:Uncharacterized protein n=1 Tax=Paramecium octaurelia TaxID=43137 RepID=A0A8S1U2Q5_PAROT|nr:unnamed protein product [Paramecium octaurelia]